MFRDDHCSNVFTSVPQLITKMWHWLLLNFKCVKKNSLCLTKLVGSNVKIIVFVLPTVLQKIKESAEIIQVYGEVVSYCRLFMYFTWTEIHMSYGNIECFWPLYCGVRTLLGNINIPLVLHANVGDVSGCWIWIPYYVY